MLPRTQKRPLKKKLNQNLKNQLNLKLLLLPQDQLFVFQLPIVTKKRNLSTLTNTKLKPNQQKKLLLLKKHQKKRQ